MSKKKKVRARRKPEKKRALLTEQHEPKKKRELLAEQRKKMADKGFVTAKEAAEQVGVSLTTMYSWLDNGVVKGRRIHRARYVRETDLEEYR